MLGFWQRFLVFHVGGRYQRVRRRRLRRVVQCGAPAEAQAADPAAAGEEHGIDQAPRGAWMVWGWSFLLLLCFLSCLSYARVFFFCFFCGRVLHC